MHSIYPPNSTVKATPRFIAYYLPQFHPIPENDRWWGPGFTEWTNTAKARPLFRNHYQPHVPADLGFYDLRLPESREAQAKMAREHGVEGFCYYHYWFGNGQRLLERPLQEVLASGKPELPFCLCWANETWTGVWHGSPKRILIEQTYPGPQDAERHFQALLPAFRDPRYIKVDGKPLFVIYSPDKLPDASGFIRLWQQLARRAGLEGLYFVGHENEPWLPEANGFDAATVRTLHLARKIQYSWFERIKANIRRKRGQPALLFQYEEAIRHFVLEECLKTNVYPCVIPNWDNTPRSSERGLVLQGSTPELFERHLRAIVQQVVDKPAQHQIIFIKSWNEWAEGNHLEPDLKFGRAYLEVLRKAATRQKVTDAPSSPVLRNSAIHSESLDQAVA
jgi:lipopolysaccharide biosynthesis protein